MRVPVAQKLPTHLAWHSMTVAKHLFAFGCDDTGSDGENPVGSRDCEV